MIRTVVEKRAGPKPPRWSVAENVNHYQVLGVGRLASNREIDFAFFGLASIWHPLVCRRCGGAEVWARIAEAHKVLANQVQRSRYNLTLPQATPAQSSHPAVAAYQRTATGHLPEPGANVNIGV